MAGHPPIPILVLRVLVVMGVEASLLAWGLGGYANLLATPRALALIALWVASGLVLSFARATRSKDTQKTERDPLAMLALALLPVAIPPLAGWGGRTATWPLPAPEVVGWLGVGAVAMGLWIRVSAMLQLGARFSPLVALQREHGLETTGWYARVRHPGYLGSLLANWGAAVAFGSAVALPLAVVMTAFQWDRVRREERLLAAHFGDEWRAYAARTGALLPRLASR
jgi:protein-S-isoprenylcysteine O-methyltransferase Ste14